MKQNIHDKSYEQLKIGEKTYNYYKIDSLKEDGVRVDRLPYSIRVLLESVIRQCDGFNITEEHIRNLAHWNKDTNGSSEVPFLPARVILQDFTGVPAVVDLASMR